MLRHPTVSAFVSTPTHTLLHFHAKNQMWLPPGGHIEPNEDPTQAVHREVLEETGLQITILPTTAPFPYDEPSQLPPPVTIMIEDIAQHPVDGPHQHIDHIYFTQIDPVPSPESQPTPTETGWHWVDADTLRRNTPISPRPDAPPLLIPEDVRVLGLAAIQRTSEYRSEKRPDAQR